MVTMLVAVRLMGVKAEILELVQALIWVRMFARRQ